MKYIKEYNYFMYRRVVLKIRFFLFRGRMTINNIIFFKNMKESGVKVADVMRELFRDVGDF